MANEIQVDYAAGNVLYAIIRNPTGQVWYAAGQSFENWGTDGHSADDYAIALTDRSGSRYVGDIDTNLPAGQYSIQWFVQAGASPADTDTLAGGRDIDGVVADSVPNDHLQQWPGLIQEGGVHSTASNNGNFSTRQIIRSTACDDLGMRL